MRVLKTRLPFKAHSHDERGENTATRAAWSPIRGHLAKLSPLLFAVFLCVPPTTFGAGAVILSNYGLRNGEPLPVYYLEAGRLAGEGCYVEIWGGPDTQHLQLLKGWASVIALSDGLFDGGDAAVPSVADRTVGWFQVLAWKGESTVSGWTNAAERVRSAPFSQLTGNATPPNLAQAAPLYSFPENLVIRPVASPALNIRSTGDQVTISWSNSEPGFVLESADRLGGSNWVRAAEAPVVQGDQNVVTTALTNSARYFRLRK